MSLLGLLSEDLETKVRQKQSELMKTEKNPFMGTSFVEGRQWFSNGYQEVLLYDCPKGFEPGRLPQSEQTIQRKVEAQLGRSWWNNGTKEMYSHDQPKGYQKGRLPKRGNTWKPVKLLDTQTEKTLNFENYKLCYTFLKVTKKVFMNRLKNQSLVNNRYLICA